MTESEDPDYLALMEIARRKGVARNALSKPENVKLAAMLKVKQPDLFANLKLAVVTWPSRVDWNKLVNAKVGEATDKRKKRDEAKEAEARLAEAEKKGLSIINFEEPTDVAADFREQRRPHLIFAETEWLDYLRNRYVPLTEREVRAALQTFLLSGVNAGDGEPCRPNRRDLDDVVDALKNLTFRSHRETDPPTWLDASTEGDDPDPKMAISCRNGILDATTGEVLPHTYRFFTRNGLDFDYEDPMFCDAPRTWLKFLASVWDGPKGQQSIDALQEWMGYLLTGKTSYQKMLMILGPPGSGKGTIARVISDLVGLDNVAEMSVTKLGKDFGLQALIGKQVLMVPDLRLGKDTNVGGVTETLLNITGEDRVSIGRKFLTDLPTKLNTRVVLFSNLELVLPDQSGAINRRLFPLVMRKSFTKDGKEDTTLSDKLRAEYPEILTWCIVGLQRLESRLKEDGTPAGFLLTDDGRAMLEGISRRGSTVKAFLDEVCDLDPKASIDKTTLFDAFEGWCAEADLDSLYSHETFTKELRAASGYNVEPTRLRVDGKRVQLYLGVQFKESFKDYKWGEPGEDDGY